MQSWVHGKDGGVDCVELRRNEDAPRAEDFDLDQTRGLVAEAALHRKDVEDSAHRVNGLARKQPWWFGLESL